MTQGSLAIRLWLAPLVWCWHNVWQLELKRFIYIIIVTLIITCNKAAKCHTAHSMLQVWIPWPNQSSGSLNNWEEFAAFVNLISKWWDFQVFLKKNFKINVRSCFTTLWYFEYFGTPTHYSSYCKEVEVVLAMLLSDLFPPAKCGRLGGGIL